MKAHPAGSKWERLAETYLNGKGLKTRWRNFHCRSGEIDLVMNDGDTVVFVEVRYRRSQQYGGATGSVTRQKQLKIISAAGMLLSRKPSLARRPCRFDVVSVSGNQQNLHFNWVQNAFDSSQ